MQEFSRSAKYPESIKVRQRSICGLPSRLRWLPAKVSKRASPWISRLHICKVYMQHPDHSPFRALPSDVHTSGPRRIRSTEPGDGQPGCIPQSPCLLRRTSPEDQPAQGVSKTPFGLLILSKHIGIATSACNESFFSHSHQSARQLIARAATAVRH